MEIEALSNSTSTQLWSYFRTRFPAWLVIALPLLMAAPAIVYSGIATLNEAAIVFGMALLLFVEFRLWDDLCDREQECRENPQRVLCRVPSITPFIVMLLVLVLINFLLVAWLLPWQSVALLLGLHGFLAVWYAIRASINAGPVANYHAILLKYPVCGLLLSLTPQRSPTLQLYASIVVVYLVLCIAEVVHDGRLRAKRSARICLWLEMLLLGVVVGLLLSIREGNS